MAFTLPALNFAPDALEPYISQRTFEFHHGKHHQTYVTKTNDMVKGTPLEGKSLEEVVQAAAKEGNKGLFNNSAQHWNHSFFWECLAPKAGGKPSGKIAAAIDKDLGGYDAFRKTFADSAAGNFGSGWTWLVVGKDGKLAVTNTSNAELPLTKGETALLTVDVWEHAYYLDYQNRRPDFVSAYLDHLLNWDFAEANLAKA